MITIDDLSFRYAKDEPYLFSGYSERLLPGVTLLKGYSGSGKSTLLRLCAGYLKPNSGTITYSSGQPPCRQFQQESLGYLFQKLNLLPHLSLRRNITMAADIAGQPKARIGENIELWADRLSLTPLLDKRPEKLSVGQQQRGAILRVFVKEPTVVMLDEPTSGLDDMNTSTIVQAIRDYLTPEHCCIIATHDPRLESLEHRKIEFESIPSIT